MVKNPPANAGGLDSIPDMGGSLGKEIATLSSDLEVQWTEEPGGLQSTGSQRVKHDLVPEQQ